jgi:hemin uptake protein HemP
MPFITEYIPATESEKSEFAKSAKIRLNTGHSRFDAWTIDRENEMVLLKIGSGHSLEEARRDNWEFLCPKGMLRFNTTITQSTTKGNTLQLTRSIGFIDSQELIQPDKKIIEEIKGALESYKDYGVMSEHANCHLVLTGL